MQLQNAGPSPLTTTLIELRRHAIVIAVVALALAGLSAVYVFVLRSDQTTFTSTITYVEPDVQAARAQIPKGLFSSVSTQQEARELLALVSQETLDKYSIDALASTTSASLRISSSGSAQANRVMKGIIEDYLAKRSEDYVAALDVAVEARSGSLERAEKEAADLQMRFDGEASEGSVAREAIVVRQVELDKTIQSLREDITAIDTFAGTEPAGVDRVLDNSPAGRYTTSSKIQSIALVFIVAAMIGALVVAGAAVLRIPNDDE